MVFCAVAVTTSGSGRRVMGPIDHGPSQFAARLFLCSRSHRTAIQLHPHPTRFGRTALSRVRNAVPVFLRNSFARNTPGYTYWPPTIFGVSLNPETWSSYLRPSNLISVPDTKEQPPAKKSAVLWRILPDWGLVRAMQLHIHWQMSFRSVTTSETRHGNRPLSHSIPDRIRLASNRSGRITSTGPETSPPDFASRRPFSDQHRATTSHRHATTLT